MTYEAWRCMFQSAEQAARSAYSRVEELARRVAELEAERAEREAGKLQAYLSNDRTQFFIPSMEGKDVKHAPYLAHWMAGWTTLYAAQPVTAPVRLTDKQIAESHANEIMNCLQDPCDKSESVMPMPHDVNRFVRAIETAVLRANGFNIDHPEHVLELVGLRGCNSRHGGAREPDPCVYRYLMRTTDTGCTGCADRDEDQAAEAGGSIQGEPQ